MLNEKKISKSGGITIPSHIRREMGIAPGEKVEVQLDGSGDLKLKRIEGSCILCGTHEDLMKVDKVFICYGCGKEVHEALKSRGGEEQ